MLYKEYGKTGKKVSVIGFGGMRFLKEYSIHDSAQVVRRANELGINYFDTAPTYCDDTSEEIFGEASKDMPHPFYVSTKSMLRMDPTADDVRRRIEKSLKRLGVDRITFYHMWCILDLNQYRRVISPGGPYEGALKAKEEGLIEHIVCSTHCNGSEIEIMVDEGYFEGFTIGYNIINFPFREQGLKAAYNKGYGVATMNPLGGGVIPQNPQYFEYIKEREDQSVAEAAIRFNAAHKEISVVLAGMGTIQEVEQNVAAVDGLYDITDEKLVQMKKKINMGMNSLCTGCNYCVDCPEGIDVSKYMDAYNYKILGRPDKAILNRLKNQWNMPLNKQSAIHRCIACGRCEEVCTQRLPIIERLNYIKSAGLQDGR